MAQIEILEVDEHEQSQNVNVNLMHHNNSNNNNGVHVNNMSNNNNNDNDNNNNNNNNDVDDSHHHQNQENNDSNLELNELNELNDINNNKNNNNNKQIGIEIAVSYHDEEHGIFGCKHYARNCWLKAECCNTWYVCRFCHDERNEDIDQGNTNNGYINNNDNINFIKPHQINRYSTKWVKCMQCGTQQRASKYCINCTVEHDINSSVNSSVSNSTDSSIEIINNNHSNSNSNNKEEKDEDDDEDVDDDGDIDIDLNDNHYCFGRYYCDVCKFYDDKQDKQIFHCIECGLCRLGKKSDYIHCKRCGCCLNYKYYAKHPCIENSLKSDCPICFTYLFKSRDPVTFFMPCGHPIHYDCLMQYAKVGNWKCPICRTAWYDEESEKRKKIVNAIKSINQNNDNNNTCF